MNLIVCFGKNELYGVFTKVLFSASEVSGIIVSEQVGMSAVVVI